MRYLAVSVALPVIILLCGCSPSEEELREAKTKQLREFAASSLKDPKSSQFRNERFVNGVLCGEINSKNSFGAYVGFKRFFTVGERFAFIESIGQVAGNPPATDIDDTIRNTKIENEALEASFQRLKSGGVELTEREIEERKATAEFKHYWKKYCSSDE